MGRGEEHLVQFPALPVEPGVQQDQEKERKAQIHRSQSKNPGPFAVREHPEKEERRERDDQQQHRELFTRTVDVEAQLTGELQRLSQGIRRLDGLILAAFHRVEEPFGRARIAPVHRRIGHRRHRHVEIADRAKAPENKGHQGHADESLDQGPRFDADKNRHRQDTDAEDNGLQQPDQREGQQRQHGQGHERLHEPFGHDREVDRSDDGHHADGVEDNEQRRVLLEDRDVSVRGHEQRTQVGDRTADAQLPASVLVRRSHEHKDAHRRDQQRHVVGQTNAEEEHPVVEVAQLVRGIDPAQQEGQRQHERQHAQRVDFHDDRLAPHVAVEAHQQGRHQAGHDADHRLLLPVQGLQRLDALDHHAAAARNQQSD